MEWFKTSEQNPPKSGLYFCKVIVEGVETKIVLEWTNMFGGAWVVEDDSDYGEITWLYES